MKKKASHEKIYDLLDSEKLLDSVLHTADIGLAIIDSNNRVIRVNNGIIKMLGYKEKDMLGKSILNLTLPQERTLIMKKHRQLFEGKLANYERKIKCKNGEIIDVYITNALYREGRNKYLIKTIRNISENKKYRELLQETEKATRMGGFVLDLIGGTTTWTDELYNIYELPRRTTPSFEALLPYFPKEKIEEIKKFNRRALKKTASSTIEHEIITAKQKKKWVRATITPVKLKYKTIKIFGTVQDITEKKATESEIERLSWVARHTNNGIMLSDQENRIEWVNESFEKIMGYKLKELRGFTPRDLFYGPQTDPVTADRIKGRLQKHQPVSEVIINYRKNKKPIWIKVDLAPIFKGKKVINHVAIITDLTDLIKSQEMQLIQESLLQSKKLMEAISKDFPNGMIGVLNTDLNYTYIGGSEIKKLRHRREDFIGKKLFSDDSEEANKYAKPFLNRAFNGETVVFEVKAGENVYWVNAVPLKSESGPVAEVLVVIRNITQRKTLEEQTLRALHKQQELNELKSKFVSVASHEFRTPLSTILSSNFLIAQYNKQEDESKRVKHINRINTAVANLTDIINEFLSLDRIETGKVENNPCLFNITDCCNEIIEEMQSALKEGQIIIMKQYGDRKDAFLDKKHVRNVIINLISNAIKYSPPAKPIYIEYKFEKNKLCIEVKDEGIGIPKEDQKHLFEKFFRANNASIIQGTGMGLHIVKRFMDMMGGTVSFKSIENEGSVFSLEFPQAELSLGSLLL